MAAYAAAAMKNRRAFVQDVLAQAMGTVIGGGLLFFIGKFSGVLTGVRWNQVVVFVVMVLTAVGGMASLIAGYSKQRQAVEELADVRRVALVKKALGEMTPEEAAAWNIYSDKGRWNNLSNEEREMLSELMAGVVTRHL